MSSAGPQSAGGPLDSTVSDAADRSADSLSGLGCYERCPTHSEALRKAEAPPASLLTRSHIGACLVPDLDAASAFVKALGPMWLWIDFHKSRPSLTSRAPEISM